jgi:hypothetical protein
VGKNKKKMLTDYKPQFDNAYEDTFQKVLVGKEICNTRFESVLSYGASVERVAFDISGVRVRDTVRNVASTIDPVTDSNEVLTINLEKEAVFEISDGEKTQTGPMQAAEKIGAEVAIKVAADLDARIFAEVLNAYQTFDTGDLTTLASTGTPITQSSTTVPQMVSRMPAKLKKGANQTITGTNMAFVIDSYGASDIEQYLLGKQFAIVEAVFKNGYAGLISSAQVYVSENLTGEALFTFSVGLASDADTITIGGVVFTLKTALSSGPAVVGEVLLGATFADTITNLAAAINAPGTTTTKFTALSAADQLVITDVLKLTAVATTTTLKITGIGSGRIVISESATNIALTYNEIHCYYGKKGAIDLVVQDIKKVDMRPCSDRRATNVFTSYLAGLKTFADGAKKFLDVHIAA